MIKKLALVLSIFTAVLIGGCSSASNRDIEKTAYDRVAKYNNVIATFVTTQGNIDFYLYPDASPVSVANFINLAKRGFYNNTKIIRHVDNFIVQGGDPTGTGEGGPGYSIKDEVSAEWLDFFQYGMLAMANAGPDTGGSQFFMTLYPAEHLNGRHTILGEVVSKSDFSVIRKLEVGDVIREIKFSKNADLILSLNKKSVDNWNKILDRKFPKLAKYPVANASEEQKKAYQEELNKLYQSKAKNKKKSEFESPVTKIIRAVDNMFSGSPK